MKRKRNGRLGAGFALTLLSAYSYLFFFIRFPITRDFPWVSLLLFGVGFYLLGTGLYRAYARPAEYRGKLLGPVLTTLSLAIVGLFCYGAFYEARRLPSPEQALRVGQPAPDFSLADVNGQKVALSQLRSGMHGTLLIFYRGYW